MKNSHENSSLTPAHWEEIVKGSGVSEVIAHLNFWTITDASEADKLLNRNAKKRWQHSDNLVPAWTVAGIDPKTGERWLQGVQLKSDTPVERDGKPQKYLSASGYETAPLFLDNGEPDYWQKVLGEACATKVVRTIPLFITEGAKKAACLLTLQHAAISLPGVWNAQLKGRLKTCIKEFCGIGRRVYLCFDSDQLTNPKVQQALDRLGRLLSAEGCVVSVVLWNVQYKGIDDLYVQAGKEAVNQEIANAFTFEEWRDSLNPETDIESYREDLEVKDKFNATIQKLDHIFTKSESASAQRWELIRLAKSTKIPLRELTALYDEWRDDREEIKPLTLGEFRQLTPDKREWLIASILPAQTTGLVHSAPGTGKTLLFYDFAKAIATGSPWNGYPTQKGKVLIVQTDEPTSETRDRFEVSGMFEAVEDGQILVLSQWGFSQLRKLERWVEDFKPSLIVIDSLSTANRRSGHEEKDVQYAHGLIDLRDVADKHRCSIWVLHHSNKAGTTRGSTALEANVSEVWRIRTGEPKEDLTKTQRVLSVGKSRAGCTGDYLLELDVENFSWASHGEHSMAQQTRSNPGAELLSFLTLNADQWFEPDELAQRSFGGGSRDAVRKQCKRLERNGLLRSEERVKTVNPKGAVRFQVFQGIRALDAVSSASVQRSNDHIQSTFRALDVPPVGLTDSESEKSKDYPLGQSDSELENKHYSCIPEASVQRLESLNDKDSERWTHQNSKASSAQNDVNSSWVFWTNINTQVEVVGHRGERTQIRVPGQSAAKWVPTHELKEGAA